MQVAASRERYAVTHRYTSSASRPTDGVHAACQASARLFVYVRRPPPFPPAKQESPLFACGPVADVIVHAEWQPASMHPLNPHSVKHCPCMQHTVLLCCASACTTNGRLAIPHLATVCPVHVRRVRCPMQLALPCRCGQGRRRDTSCARKSRRVSPLLACCGFCGRLLCRLLCAEGSSCTGKQQRQWCGVQCLAARQPTCLCGGVIQHTGPNSQAGALCLSVIRAHGARRVTTTIKTTLPVWHAEAAA